MAETSRTYWSKDPEEAPLYSDWRITFARNGIVDDDDDDDDTMKKNNECGGGDNKNKNEIYSSSSTVTYHVHRNMLGPRSEYFNRVFWQSLSKDDNDDIHGRTTASFSEAHNQHSRIEFSSVLTQRSFDSIIQAFEKFLDYCYYFDTFSYTPDRFEKTNLSPVALHFLTDYFQIKNEDFMNHINMYTEKKSESLLRKVKNQANEYYSVLCKDIINFRSAGLNVEAIQKMFVACCTRNRLCLSLGSPLSKVIDSALWLSIASSVGKGDICPGNESNDWSNNVAYFIGENAIDADAFRILTDKNLLPTVDPNAAVILLDKERAHGLHECLLKENETKDTAVDGVCGVDDVCDGVRDDNGSTVLTCLQVRCVESFNLANLESESQERLRERALRVMSHTVVNEFLRKNLCRTRQTLKRKNDEISQTKKEKNDVVKEKSNLAKEKIHAVSALKREKDDAVNKWIDVKTKYDTTLINQIIEVIARHQKKFKVRIQDIVSFLPDISRKDIKGILQYPSIKQQIIYTASDDAYTVGQDIITNRASNILKSYKKRKKERGESSDLTKVQLYAALRGLTSSQSDVDQIMETLRSRGFLVFPDPYDYNPTPLYTINK